MSNKIQILILIFISILILISCDFNHSNLYRSANYKIKKGLNADTIPKIFKNLPDTAFSLNIQKKDIFIQAYFLGGGKGIGLYIDLYSYIDNKLFFWGGTQEFVKNNDPFINEIGEKSIEFLDENWFKVKRK